MQPQNYVVTQQPNQTTNAGYSTEPTFEHVRTGMWKDDWCGCFNNVSETDTDATFM